ncbi:hypothetical protein ACFYT4_26805 [Streptomyces sp. NPDC004609]
MMSAAGIEAALMEAEGYAAEAAAEVRQPSAGQPFPPAPKRVL